MLSGMMHRHPGGQNAGLSSAAVLTYVWSWIQVLEMSPKSVVSATTKNVRRCWEWGDTALLHRSGMLCMDRAHAYLFHHMEKQECIPLHAYVLTLWFSTVFVNWCTGLNWQAWEEAVENTHCRKNEHYTVSLKNCWVFFVLFQKTNAGVCFICLLIFKV